LPVTSTGTFYHRPSDAYIFATVCQLFVIGRLLERALQDLSSDSSISVLFWIFVTSSSFKVGLFFGPPLPSSLQVLKEISGHCHFSPARLTVTGCSASGWLPFFSIKVVKGERYQRCIAHLSVYLLIFCSKSCDGRAAEPFATTIPPAFGRLPWQGLLQLFASHQR
jgi:hypothetical protein